MEKEKEKREQSENNEGEKLRQRFKRKKKKKQLLSLNLTPSFQISLLCVFPENIYQVPKQEAGVWSVLQQQMY